MKDIDTNQQHRRFRRRVSATTYSAALTILSMFSATTASANPEGGNVVSGEATIQQFSPTVMNIDQSSQRAIIEWQDFSIASNERVNFDQPIGGATLNRVLGSNLSTIAGQLSATGQVFLINPNGLVFSSGAQLDVGGLVATTANMTNSRFMGGELVFDQAASNNAASITVESEAQILVRGGTAGSVGLAALVAPSVEQSGIIQAELGQVIIAGASTFTLDPNGDGLYNFAITGLSNHSDSPLVSIPGEINAAGGSILITAAAASDLIGQVVNVSGRLFARSVSDDNGTIVLSGGCDVSGAVCGDIGLTDTALVDVLADDAGETAGTVIVDAASVQAGAGVVIAAAAIGDNGQGGSIVVNSSDATIDAAFFVDGGASGGDAGSIRFTSAQNAAINGQLSARSSGGTGGTIEATAGTLSVSPEAVLDVSGASAGSVALTGDTIEVAGQLLADGYDAGAAGSVALMATDTISISGIVQARGMSGGQVSASGTDISIEESGGIDVSGDTGGSVSVQASGELSHAGDIFANGESIGGSINLAAQSIVADGELSATGVSTGLDQGFVGLTSGTGAYRVTSLINAGGSVSLASENDVGLTIADDIVDQGIATRSLSSALQSGADVQITSARSVQLAALVDGRPNAGASGNLNVDVLNGDLQFDSDCAGPCGILLNDSDLSVSLASGSLDMAANDDIELAGRISLGDGALDVIAGDDISLAAVRTSGTITLDAAGVIELTAALGGTGDADPVDPAIGGLFVNEGSASPATSVSLADIRSTGAVAVTAANDLVVEGEINSGGPVTLTSNAIDLQQSIFTDGNDLVLDAATVLLNPRTVATGQIVADEFTADEQTAIANIVADLGLEGQTLNLTDDLDLANTIASDPAFGDGAFDAAVRLPVRSLTLSTGDSQAGNVIVTGEIVTPDMSTDIVFPILLTPDQNGEYSLGIPDQFRGEDPDVYNIALHLDAGTGRIELRGGVATDTTTSALLGELGSRRFVLYDGDELGEANSGDGGLINYKDANDVDIIADSIISSNTINLTIESGTLDLAANSEANPLILNSLTLKNGATIENAQFALPLVADSTDPNGFPLPPIVDDTANVRLIPVVSVRRGSLNNFTPPTGAAPPSVGNPTNLTLGSALGSSAINPLAPLSPPTPVNSPPGLTGSTGTTAIGGLPPVGATDTSVPNAVSDVQRQGQEDEGDRQAQPSGDDVTVGGPGVAATADLGSDSPSSGATADVFQENHHVAIGEECLQKLESGECVNEASENSYLQQTVFD